MADRKYMAAQEFRDLGYLQEVNRRFLHPLGLALEVVTDDEGKITGFGGVWDYRDDPEGMTFGGLDEADAREKAERVDAERRRHFEARCELFGVPRDIAQAVADADVQPLGWLHPDERVATAAGGDNGGT